ncbi:DUF6236 family protein [Escherichia coli]|uniref:DUF6236 family protein n=1 Tax=Escherichia coli TaxID=562 RepID=UPI000DDA70A4|nr:DUF6236 family protein [Escherichia coli]
MKRGVVALPFEILQHGTRFKTGKILSPLELNYFALYWDKISVPQNTFIRFKLNNEQLFEDVGLLSRPLVKPKVPGMAGNFADFYLSSQLSVADQLRNEDKTTIWSIHQTGENRLFMPDGAVSKEAVRLELENLLPVPGPHIALHEILEFKQRRNAELQALHSYCDELYFEIINSGDPRLQAAKSFTRLKKAIEDLDKLNAEGWRSPIRFDLDISPEFDLTACRAGIATILNAFNSPHVVESIAIGSVLTLVEGFVKIRPKLQSMREGGGENLAYVSKGRIEGIYK